MKNIKSFYIYLLFFGLFTIVACNPDEDPCVDCEGELITTLNYLLNPTNGGDVVILSFTDIDGDGGNAPIITGGTLQANMVYTGGIELLNESVDPVENISDEVDEEADDHQFFFDVSGVDLTISYSDTDSNNNPVGLSTRITTGAAGSGNLTIILRHQPDKNAEGVSDGNIGNAGGDTDIEVTFPVEIQ